MAGIPLFAHVGREKITPPMNGCLVDVQNALDIEERVHAVFHHLDQPISHYADHLRTK